MKNPITSRSQDYSQWYLDIVEHAQLAENSAVRGCMVIKPYGYAIWEQFQSILDAKFKELGHVNAYFPIFIPKSFLAKEAQHVEGFAQESAVVTHYRLQTDPQTKEVTTDPEAKLSEELVVRPTSETIIYDTYSRWIESHRDLPVSINQWANVVRWEMRTRPFLRTAEFLWQEGHTAHATHDEAEAETKQMLDVYRWFAEDILAIPVITGEKTASERFAGALRTYCIEAMMQDNKALQAGTSHNLGQNFAKAFNVMFTNAQGEREYVWQTSWGVSTRLIGALIMAHSDDQGLVLPPKIAPIQVVIVPIWKDEAGQKAVFAAVEKIKNKLTNQSIKVNVDQRDHISPGAKFNDWERKGVPIRVEIGPKDLQSNSVILARRDLDTKQSVPIDDLTKIVQEQLEEMQSQLFQTALQRQQQHIFKVDTYQEFKDIIDRQAGFVLAHWDGTAETEAKIKQETRATIRCIPFDSPQEKGKCIYSGRDSNQRVLFAKAY